jgi:phosphocarrier protein
VTEATVVLANRLGLHARAAAKMVHLASGFECDITVERDGERVEAKSILGILLLAAAQGTELILRCDGRDEEEALEALTQLIANRFGEGE